jgi:2-polyprenyl-3-methyl-5-hydroxy-6-metoxy-1,4-benzoquinol methylase
MTSVMPTEVDPAGAEPRAILQTVDFRNARALEVGAGDGRLTFRYADEPGGVDGIDTKEPEIKLATKIFRAELRGHTRFLRASGARRE